MRSLVTCIGACALAACSAASGAPQQQASAERWTAAPGAHCRQDERTVYSCDHGRASVSICANDRQISYRYGPRGRPELEIASDGRDGRVHAGRIVGGGSGGGQASLRFTRNGHDYVVYAATAGEYTEIAGATWSGLVVRRGDRILRHAQCPQTGARQQLSLSGLPFALPEDDRAEEAGWY